MAPAAAGSTALVGATATEVRQVVRSRAVAVFRHRGDNGRSIGGRHGNVIIRQRPSPPAPTVDGTPGEDPRP